eukprot:g10838.t1
MPGAGEATADAEDGSSHAHGKGQGPDGRWMLKLIYPNAVNLESYLEVWLGNIADTAAPGSSSAAAMERFGGPASYLSRESDGVEFKKMLKETLVAYCPVAPTSPVEPHAPLPRHASLQHRSSMADLLDRVVKSLLRSSSVGGQGNSNGGYFAAQGDDPRRNVLSLGCRVAGPQATSELLSVQGVACTFPNTTVNVIRSPPWELLLSRIGDDLMFALLRQHAVLQRLPNRCYMQLVGRPVPDLCRHLGLTTGTLSSAATAGTPATAATAGAARNRGKAPPPPNLSRSASISSCNARKRPGGQAPSSVNGAGVSPPEASQVPSAAAGDGAVPGRSGGVRGGNGRHPVARPVVLLPRRRIFYSSTFVRRAGFPRGHVFNSCGQRSPVGGGEGASQPPPLRTAPNTTHPSNSLRHGETTASTTSTSVTRVARGLVVDVFGGALDGSGTGQYSGGDGFHGRGGTGVLLRTRADGRVAPRKLPKRLRRAVPLFEEMVRRAHRCRFGRLLEAHCPLPESVRRAKGARRTAGLAGQAGQEQHEPEASGLRGVQTEATLKPSPSKASTVHEEEETSLFGEGEDHISATPLSQEERVGNGHESTTGGGEVRSSGGEEIEAIEENEAQEEQEEETMDSGSTVKDLGAVTGSAAVYSGGMQGNGDGVGSGAENTFASAHAQGKGESRRSSGGTPAERAAKRRRLVGDDGAVEVSGGAGPQGEDDPGNRCASESSSGEENDGFASDATLLDVDVPVPVPDAGTSAAAAVAAAGVQAGREMTHGQASPFSMDPDVSFIEMATEHRRVADFLCQACHRIFPIEVWGSKHNMVCLARAIERFIVLRRHENISVLEVTAGMRTSDMEWMSLGGDGADGPEAQRRKRSGKKQKKPIPGGGPCHRKREGSKTLKHPRKSGTEHKERAGGAKNVRGRKGGDGGEEDGKGGGGGATARLKESRQGRRRSLPPSDLAKRTQLLEALVLWTFTDVIVPLLRSLFYVTECETSSQEVFFFRKPVWAKFRTASLRHLTARQYRRITAQEAFRRRDGGLHGGGGTSAAANLRPFQPLHPGSSCTQSGSPTRNRKDGGGGGGAKARGQNVWAFPVSGVRLVPKANGVRAITNLSKRVWVDRGRVQWVKGVPLPAPRATLPTVERTTSNASAPPLSGAGASRETLRAVGRLASDGAGGRAAAGATGGAAAAAVPAALAGGGNGGRAKRGKLAAGRGRGRGGSTLLPSTNMQLSNAFHVLKHEYSKKPSLVGAGVFGLDDVFARIKPFVSRNLRPLPASARGRSEDVRRLGEGAAGGLPPLYFASVDIRHCYDTVDQARLMDIVRPLVTSEDYVVQKYTKAHPFKAMGRVQVNHVKEAVAMEDMLQFQTRCEELADESVDTIFTDQVVYGIVSRNDVLDMVEDHITHNVVRVPAAGGSGRGAYFQQAVGIPQGSVLSGLLCNYFFGHIERCLLGGVLETRRHSTHNDGGANQAAAASGFRGADGGGEGEDGVRGRALCWDSGTTGASSSSGSRRPAESLSPVRSATGRKRPRLAAEGTEEQEQEEEGGDKEEDGRGDGAGARGVSRAIRNPSRRARAAETDRRASQGSAGAGTSSGGGGGGVFPDPEGDCTLLRQVDDFLLISTSRAKAEAFVRVMHDKRKTGKWGFSVHEAKTVVNFEMALEEERAGGPARQVRRVEGRMFPWCGLRFDTATCEVMANYSRYTKSSVSESLTVESRSAGACLMGKMKRFMSPKCHALMLDEGELGINSRSTVLLNVYEMLLVCAAKTAASALRLPRGPAGNAPLLSRGALETTAYAYSLIQSRSNRRKGSFGTSKGVWCVCKIYRFEVTWLGLHAFREVFAAFSRKDRGFTHCKLDMEKALVEAAGSTGGGVIDGGTTKPPAVEGSHGWRKERAPANGARRGGAFNRLRHVVRSPDAMSLLHTLTA